MTSSLWAAKVASSRPSSVVPGLRASYTAQELRIAGSSRVTVMAAAYLRPPKRKEVLLQVGIAT
jgi:hypothetical protein